MLALIFRTGKDHLALDVRQVVEVVPAVELRTQPEAPNYVAGIFNFRGVMVPVIDLCRLLQNRRAWPLFSTRIILVHYTPTSTVLKDAPPKVLGLIAEAVTETRKLTEEEAQPTGITLAGAAYLGQVISEGDKLIQFVRIEDLLPAELQEILFRPEGESASPAAPQPPAQGG